MKILALMRNESKGFKKNLWLFLAAYFLVLFNYPLIRASSTSFFFEGYGAKSSPVAWLLGVVFLSVTIFISNKSQKFFSVQKVFFFTSIVSALIFGGSIWGISLGIKELSFVSFIWKEIYIVLQVHLLLAYANNFFAKDVFKMLVGPVGAVGSLGAILGGILTSYLSSWSGTSLVMTMGAVAVFLPALLFFFTVVVYNPQEEKTQSPLASLHSPEVRKYVLYIAGVVALTQFIINIADFRFNLVFEQQVQTSGARTTYLGNLYAVINTLTFIFQFLLLPFLLPRVNERSLHLFIPLSYLLTLGGLILGQGIGLLPVTLLYVYFKAADYSLFSAAKEILYQPLSASQKYGAKYLTDMLVYRFAKALIAAVLIYLQSSLILNMMMVIFLLLWVMMIVRLFQVQRKLFR
jgi:ATP:ADP antiporter, AAA family